jgi:hypothetical protein
VIRIYDGTGNVVEAHENKRDFKAKNVLLVRHAMPHVKIAFAPIKGNQVGAEPAENPRKAR